MKKAMLLFVALLFSVSANAASLSWVSSTDPAMVLSGAGSTISATEIGPAGMHTDTLEFTTDADTYVTSIATVTQSGDISVSSVTLNGVALADLGIVGLTQQWALAASQFIQLGSINTLVVAISAATGVGLLNIQVSQVPVPAALFLFAPALLGFLGLRRKATLAAA